MKNKVKLVMVLVICFLSQLNAGNIVYVKNPGAGINVQPNIQAAVDLAKAGDMIILPNGSFPLLGTVKVDKMVSITSSFCSRTVLFRPETSTDASLYNIPMFQINFNSDVNSRASINGILFRSKKPSMVDGDGLSKAIDTGIELINCVGFTITACRFENFGNAAVIVRHKDYLAKGLITPNKNISI